MLKLLPKIYFYAFYEMKIESCLLHWLKKWKEFAKKCMNDEYKKGVLN